MGNKLHRALKENPSLDDVKLILDTFPEAITMKSIDYGELPLHFAIEEKASHDVIKLLLEAYPKATQVKSRQGWLPLHYALCYKAADITTKMILQAFPRAVESPDVDGELPLNFALKSNASDDIIKTILEAYPKSAEMNMKGGDLPLHLALRCNYSDSIITLIFQANPEAVQKQNNDGCLPLHIACDHRASAFVIKMIFEANPEAKKVQNRKGWLPLHLALWHNAHDDIIKMLFEAYPKAAKMQNKYGYFPLHYALQEAAADDIIEMLCKEYPNALEIKNKDGKTPRDYAPSRIIPLIKPVIPTSNDEPRDSQSMIKIELMHPLMQKLAGVYQDPIKISQEITQLFNSSAGGFLTPQISSLGEYNRLFAIDGDITVLFNGTECSIPVEIFLPPGYPSDSPICYVRPSPERITETTQPNVAPNQRIDLLYRFNCTSLLDFTHKLISYFANYPPCRPHVIVRHPSQQLLDLCRRAYQTRNNESYNNIQSWLDEKLNNKNLLVEAIACKDSFNRTPLHYLAGSASPKAIVECILQYARDAPQHQDSKGKLPLHWACSYEALPEVLELLVKGYPKGIEKQDHDACTPLHYACRDRASPNVIGLMLKQCPAAAKMRNRDGELPVHAVCKDKLSASPDVLNLLIDCFPESIAELPGELLEDPKFNAVLSRAGFSVPEKKKVEMKLTSAFNAALPTSGSYYNLSVK